jgi:hypothetical protein
MPLYTPTPADPAPRKRLKTGGRKKGTPNRTTVLIREAALQVFADLQAEAGGGNDHFLKWARNNPNRFYLLLTRLLPRRVSAPEAIAPPTASDPAATASRQIEEREVSR